MADEQQGIVPADGVDAAEVERLKAAILALGAPQPHTFSYLFSTLTVNDEAASRVQAFLDAWVPAMPRTPTSDELGIAGAPDPYRPGEVARLTEDDLQKLLSAHAMRGGEIHGLRVQLNVVTQQRDMWFKRDLKLRERLATVNRQRNEWAARVTELLGELAAVIDPGQPVDAPRTVAAHGHRSALHADRVTTLEARLAGMRQLFIAAMAGVTDLALHHDLEQAYAPYVDLIPAPHAGDQVTATFDLGNHDDGTAHIQTDTGTLVGWTEPMALVQLRDGRLLRARRVRPVDGGRGDADA